MHYEATAEGAIVHGRVLAAGGPRELETIRAAAEEIGAAVFVAGNSLDCGHASTIVGVLVATAPAGRIVEVSEQLLRDAAELYERLDWSVLDAHAPGVVVDCDADEEREVSEGTFLLCWEPQAQVVLSVGCADDEDEGDREEIAWTELTGCRPIDLSEGARARYRAKAPPHSEPELHLTVRYG